MVQYIFMVMSLHGCGCVYGQFMVSKEKEKDIDIDIDIEKYI